MTDLPATLSHLCREIHADNVKAGWWSDLTTGQPILETRNRPEMLMLAVSELAEAAEGSDGGPDDKLPHLPMFDVELGDFVIRQLDQIGAEVSLGQGMPRFDGPGDTGQVYKMLGRVAALMKLVVHVSETMEHCRKGRVPDYVQAMANSVVEAFDLAAANNIDLLDIIAQKRAFNTTRADHQVENRVKDGGKQF